MSQPSPEESYIRENYKDDALLALIKMSQSTEFPMMGKSPNGENTVVVTVDADGAACQVEITFRFETTENGQTIIANPRITAVEC